MNSEEISLQLSCVYSLAYTSFRLGNILHFLFRALFLLTVQTRTEKVGRHKVKD